MQTELLATIADRLGVLASDMHYKQAVKPITRPSWMTGEAQPVPDRPDQSGVRRAVGVLRDTAKRVRR